MALEAGSAIDESELLERSWTSGCTTDLAQEMGIQIDDQLMIRPDVTVEPVLMRIAGIWHARDPQEEFWFGDPDGQLKSSLLVRRKDYIKFIQPMVPPVHVKPVGMSSSTSTRSSQG